MNQGQEVGPARRPGEKSEGFPPVFSSTPVIKLPLMNFLLTLAIKVKPGVFHSWEIGQGMRFAFGGKLQDWFTY